VDHACVEVDGIPPQRAQLTAAQPGIERGRPQRAIGDRQRSDQLGRLLRTRDPIATTTNSRKLEPIRRSIASSPSRSARRAITCNGLSVFCTVLGCSPEARHSSTSVCTSRRSSDASRRCPITAGSATATRPHSCGPSTACTRHPTIEDHARPHPFDQRLCSRIDRVADGDRIRP